MRPSRHRAARGGFLSFDALLSLAPILLMGLFVLSVSAALAGSAADSMHRQEVFDKVVSAADYTVKSGWARVGEDGLKRPNWMADGPIGPDYVEWLRRQEGLAELEISYAEPEGAHGVCIYRLVAIGEKREIARLFACGGG